MRATKEKFKRMKHDLKIWYRDIFGHTSKLKKEIIGKIGELDKLDDDSNLDNDKKKEHIELLSQLQLLNLKHESIMQQKSRVKWIQQGDNNSKFFHSSIKWRSLKSEIKGLEIQGKWNEDPNVVKEVVKEFYRKRLMAKPNLGVRLDNIQFQQLSVEDNNMLTKCFDAIEIKKAVWGCGSSKSPGPDDFNFSFIKKFWDIIGKDIIHAVEHFYKFGNISKGCNASFISLVPKLGNPITLDGYRPISLVGCIYKVISKILSNRVKKVLPKIIDGSQSAFISGRGLMDNILVANETVEDIKRKKKCGLVIKIDYEKAYDSVSWEFLYYMMERLGFCRQWISWIKKCLESATISVLVNGSLTKQFNPTRGLR